MTRSTRLIRYSVLALAASTLMACNDNNSPRPIADPPAPPAGGMMPPTPPAPPMVTPDTFVLTSGNKLVGFAAADPSKTTVTTLAVPTTETLLGGDFRPADSALYIVTKVTADNSLKVYTANTTTGALGAAIELRSNAMGAGVGSTLAGTPITLTGSKVGVDFNPLANALRIVDNTGANLRTGLGASTATTGNTFIDAPIATGLSESAYTNSFATTCQTDLYHINGTQLLLSAAPNGVTGSAAAGARLVGGLGVTATAASGFDIRTSTTGNQLVAALSVGGSYGYYTINDTTGAATLVGAIGGLGTDTVLGLAANLPSGTVANTPGNMYAITAGASPSLNTFNRPPQGSPARLCDSSAITGLTTGDVIVGADTRPSTGALIALAKAADGTGVLYTISQAGVASGRTPLSTGVLTGSSFGVDFNPVPGALRIVADDGANLRVTNVDTGATTADSPLTSASGGAARSGVTAAAYTNSIFDGGTAAASFTTALFGVDTTRGMLVRIGAEPATGGACTAGSADAGNPNCGVVNDMGSLGVTMGASNGFEIDPRSGTAFLAGTVNAATTLYTVDLATGAATPAGNFAAPVVAVTGRGAVSATVFGLTTTGTLVSFLPDNPAGVMTVGPITGVGAGETIQGIDFRPSIGPKNGTLVAMTTAAGGSTKLYNVNPATAVATLASTLAADPTDAAGAAPYTSVSGTIFGIDFNPQPDRLRVVSNTAENLRINVETGATFTDGTLTQTGIFGAAYTNSFSSTAATSLFYIGNGGGNTMLYGTTAPNAGTLGAGLDMGSAFSSVGDFDVAGGRGNFGIVMAALQPAAGGASGLYRINLATGATTKVGADIGSATTAVTLTGIAVRLQ